MIRMSNRVLYSLIGVAAIVVAGILVGLSIAGGSDSSSSATTTAAQPAGNNLAGIPQKGTVLGKAGAPATIYEFADIQCPYCADFSRDVLPSVVRQYVRTGRVKLDFRGLQFLGPDSDKGLRAVLAAGKQNRAWNMLEGLYAAQGAENSGWLTDGLLKEVAGGIQGLDVDRMLSEMDSVNPQMQKAADDANQLGVRGTPSFFVLRPPSDPQPVDLQGLDPVSFSAALEPLLA